MDLTSRFPLLALCSMLATAQTPATAAASPAVDLGAAARSGRLGIFNRTATAFNGEVHLDGRNGEGGAWIEGLNFREGCLSADVKGEDQMGASFVGLAFHGAGSDRYDVVYLRPFNFNSADAKRRSHALQYASSPNFGWQVLRERWPGKYEAELSPPPKADDWIRLELRIKGRSLNVFVGSALKPSLGSVDKGDSQQG